MGIKLVIEVLDQYHGPDARKLWLIAWAEKANDRTRCGWPTREVLSHRTGRSPSRASHIAEELVAEGVLKRDGGGNRGGPARFIMLPLPDTKSAARAHPLSGGKGAAKAHPEESLKGAPRTHSSEAGMGAPETHPSDPGKSAPRTHPKPEVKGAESARKGAESGRKGADPTPGPAKTSSLPLIPSEDQPSLIPSVNGSAEPTAQTILAAFIDWVRTNGGDLTKRTIGQLAKQIGDHLAQDIPHKHIRTGLANWYLADQNVSTFDSFVQSAMNAAPRGRLGPAVGSARPSTTDRAVADAQALKAKLAGRTQEAS